MDTIDTYVRDSRGGKFEVTVLDQFTGWDWLRNAYRDWCQVHCKGDFSVIKFNTSTVCGKFELESDAILFMLRWM